MGEYKSVLKRSRAAGLLRETWGVILSESEAERIVSSYLDEGDIQEIRFTGTSGRGFCTFNKANGIKTATLMLPAESTGKLTLGIVLHELAHALIWVDGWENDHHGQNFTTVLDNLTLSEWYWEEEMEAA